MSTFASSETYRVVYVGQGRSMRGIGPFKRPIESEDIWRRQLAEEQQQTCNTMAAEGYRLERVQPVSSSAEWQGGWTEGVWLYFRREDRGA
jgi:hypothetical protein